MKKEIISLLFLILSAHLRADGAKTPRIYLLSGQGSDERIFSKLELDTAFKYTYIPYHVPKKNASMSSYARELAQNIDTTEPFILMGVSLGGMLSMEIAQFLSPELVVLISSAKSPKELPVRYKKAGNSGIQHWIPAAIVKRSAFVLQPIFEPDRKKEKEICKAMLADKNKVFLKRSAAMISEWEMDSTSFSKTKHIHGSNDHTLPIKNITADYTIPDGSHMMALVQPEEVSTVINEILAQFKA